MSDGCRDTRPATRAAGTSSSVQYVGRYSSLYKLLHTPATLVKLFHSPSAPLSSFMHLARMQLSIETSRVIQLRNWSFVAQFMYIIRRHLRWWLLSFLLIVFQFREGPSFSPFAEDDEP